MVSARLTTARATRSSLGVATSRTYPRSDVGTRSAGRSSERDPDGGQVSRAALLRHPQHRATYLGILDVPLAWGGAPHELVHPAVEPRRGPLIAGKRATEHTAHAAAAACDERSTVSDEGEAPANFCASRV